MSNSISHLPPPWPNMAQALSRYAIELKAAEAEENRRVGRPEKVGRPEEVQGRVMAEGGETSPEREPAGSDGQRGQRVSLRA